MKKILFALFAIVALGISVAKADNDKVINKSQLPAQAQQFINQNFAGVNLSYAKEERDFLSRSYEVMLVDGTKLEFSSNGNWEEVDCRYGEVPADVVPAEIKKYVDEKFAGEKVVGIERHRNEIEVRLSNRFELTFNKDFKLVDIDK